MLGTSPSLLAQEEPYYQGKTIRVIVGFTAAGFYDRWSRLLARHIPKFIPGNPEIVVQNMPGAGTMIAANYIYNVAKPDGLTLGLIGPALYLDQLQGSKEVQFDWPRFTWIGSPERIDQVFFIRSDTRHENLDDLRRAADTPRCAATGLSTPGHFSSRYLTKPSVCGCRWLSVMAAAAIWFSHRERGNSVPRRNGFRFCHARADPHLD